MIGIDLIKRDKNEEKGWGVHCLKWNRTNEQAKMTVSTTTVS